MTQRWRDMGLLERDSKYTEKRRHCDHQHSQDHQQSSDAPLLLYCPLGHATTQPIALKLTIRPDSHDTHELEPAADEYLPAGQAAQTYVLLTYCPASQFVSSSTTLADKQDRTYHSNNHLRT